MRKIVLTFSGVASKENVHTYLKEKLELPEYYGNNLDALYDCLTDFCEPTAVGVFLPLADNDELDIDLLLYLEKVKKVFLMAERDNGEYLAVFSDDDVWKGDDLPSFEEFFEKETEEEGDTELSDEEDPDRLLAGFFESLDPANRKK